MHVSQVVVFNSLRPLANDDVRLLLGIGIGDWAVSVGEYDWLIGGIFF
jgi:hypothetical protein